METSDPRGRRVAGVVALALFAYTCVSVYRGFPGELFAKSGYRIGDWLGVAIDAWHIVWRTSLIAVACVATYAIGALGWRRWTAQAAVTPDPELAYRWLALGITILVSAALVYQLSPLYLRIPHIDEIFRMEFLQSWYQYGESRNLGLLGAPALVPYTWSERVVADLARLLDLDPNYAYLVLTPALWHLLIAVAISGLLLRRLPRATVPFVVRALFAATAGVGFWFLIHASHYWLFRQNAAAFLLVLLCAEVYLEFDTKRWLNALWLFAVLSACLFTKLPLAIVLVGACVLVPWMLPEGSPTRRGLYAVIPVVAYAVYQLNAPDLLGMVAPSLDPWAGIKAMLASQKRTFGSHMELTWEWLKYVQDQFMWVWLAIAIRLGRRLRGGPGSPFANAQLLWIVAFLGALTGWSVISFGNFSSNTAYWLIFATWFGALAVVWELAIWMSWGLRYASLAYAVLCGLMLAGIPAVQNMAANHMRILWMVYDPQVVETLRSARDQMGDEAVLLHNLQHSRLALYPAATGGMQSYMGFWYYMLMGRLNPAHVDSIEHWFAATFCEGQSLPLPQDVPTHDLWIWYWGRCDAPVPEFLTLVKSEGPMSKMYQLDSVRYQTILNQHDAQGFVRLRDRWLIDHRNPALSLDYALPNAGHLNIHARPMASTAWQLLYRAELTRPGAEAMHVPIDVPVGHHELRVEISDTAGNTVSDTTESFEGVAFTDLYNNCRVQKLCR